MTGIRTGWGDAGQDHREPARMQHRGPQHARGGTMKDDPTSAVLKALAALKEGQAQHAGALEQLRSDPIRRIDRVDSAIRALRDDITATMRLAGRAQEAAGHTRSGLSALSHWVTAMMNQTHDLQAGVRPLN